MKPKLLVMCSTKRRPEQLKRMLKSFDKTKSKGTEIIIYVSEVDPKLQEYKKVLRGRNHIIDRERNMVEVLNYFSCELYPYIKYYAEVNDDHIYRTKGWDKKLIKVIEKKGGGWGIACGDNLVGDWEQCQHPSASVISGNIVRTLGYFNYPKFQHSGCDDHQRDIGLGINRLFHVTEVIIEHMHPLVDKAEEDENYKWVYSKEQVNYGIHIYEEWKANQSESDINKLKTAIAGEGIKI